MKKNARNNFGIRTVSTAKDSFFQELEKPADVVCVNQARKFFKGTENVKIEFVGLAQ